MAPREFRDGRDDGFEALESLDPSRIDTFRDLLAAMRKTAFGGRQLGEAFEVLQAMAHDENCMVVATLSGAMTVAKMGTLLCRMIDLGMIDVVISPARSLRTASPNPVGLVHYRRPEGVPTPNSTPKATIAFTIRLKWKPISTMSKSWCNAPLGGLIAIRFGPLRRSRTKLAACCMMITLATAFSKAPISAACQCLSRLLPTPSWVLTCRFGHAPGAR